VISPGYLETVGTQLLAGRDFDRGDRAESQPVALVNESFVRTQLGGADPIGITVIHTEGGTETPFRIVGTVEDVVQARADQGMQAAVYFPYTQVGWPAVQVVVRSDLPAEVLIPGLRQAVARFNAVVPPQDMQSLEARMSATRTSPRFQMMLLGAFALVAILLAGAGLYGSLAHSVGQRRRELGVRMALGAQRNSLLWMVVRQGLTLAGAGLVLGLLFSLGANRVLRRVLYEVEPSDPITLAGVSLLLLAVTLGACFLPARRATGVDPVSVLNTE
jgi:hypothetical protein